MRGILRRLRIEHGSEEFLKIFQTRLPYNLISWNYIQPLRPKLNAITLTVPRQMVSELHPADIAEIISQVSREEGAHLFKDLDLETAAEALSELEPDKQAEIINAIDTEKAADIIEEMPPDEAADVLSDLPTEKAKEILEHIEKEEAEDIQELLSHEEDTAGGLMTNVFIAYPPDITVKEAFERFRRDAEEIETVYYINITDAQEKLVGVASLRELLLAEPSAKLSEVMETKLKTVTPDTDEMDVAEIISKYNLLALPVVDNEGTLLGVVTIDDIIDLILPPAANRQRRMVCSFRLQPYLDTDTYNSRSRCCAGNGCAHGCYYRQRTFRPYKRKLRRQGNILYDAGSPYSEFWEYRCKFCRMGSEHGNSRNEQIHNGAFRRCLYMDTRYKGELQIR
jgi:Mg/Co/Ni transporter MgtE